MCHCRCPVANCRSPCRSAACRQGRAVASRGDAPSRCPSTASSAESAVRNHRAAKRRRAEPSRGEAPACRAAMPSRCAASQRGRAEPRAAVRRRTTCPSPCRSEPSEPSRAIRAVLEASRHRRTALRRLPIIARRCAGHPSSLDAAAPCRAVPNPAAAIHCREPNAITNEAARGSPPR